MVEKKSRLYAPSGFFPESGDISSSSIFALSAARGNLRTRIPLPTSALPKLSPSSSSLLMDTGKTEGEHKRLMSLRNEIRKLVGLNAALSWTATLFAYLVIRSEKQGSAEGVVLQSLACLVCLLQVGIVILYWDKTLQHSESVRVALNLPRAPVPRLSRSHHYSLLCAIECIWHLAIPVPGNNSESHFWLFGKRVTVSFGDVAFILLVLRNLHTIRCIYWLSHLSGRRVRFFADLWRVKGRYVFILKCYLAEYALILIAQVTLMMGVVTALIDFALEHQYFSSEDRSPWDNFWIVGYTQVSIGYGDVIPQSFFGQVTVLISAFFGACLLGLLSAFSGRRMNLRPKESDLYYHLTRRQQKTKYTKEAVVLIQCWWRVMKARVRKKPEGEMVLRLFAQLTLYRSILLRCHNMQSLSMNRKVRALVGQVTLKFEQTKKQFPRADFISALVLPTQSSHFFYEQKTSLGFFEQLEESARRICVSPQAITEAPSINEPTATSRRSTAMLQLPPVRKRKSTIGLAKSKYSAFLVAFCHSIRLSNSYLDGSSVGSRSRRDERRWTSVSRKKVSDTLVEIDRKRA